jgi:hypothetical protein
MRNVKMYSFSYFSAHGYELPGIRTPGIAGVCWPE